jgi:hypothetical protein
MRDSVRFFQPRAVLLLAALVLTACGGGGGARSPDLPFPELLGFEVSCAPTPDPLEINQTSTCSPVAGSCQYREVLASGSTRLINRDCPAVSWSSSAPSVATISDAGVITGVAAGNATVTGSIDGVTQTVPVRIIEATLVDARISCAPDSINQGAPSQCSVIGQCDYELNGEPVERPCPAASWSADIGTINPSTGRYVGTTVGTATITAQVGRLTRTTQIVVRETCLQSIVLSTVPPGTTSVIAGNNVVYAATALYQNGTSAVVTSDTTFSSTKPNVGRFPPGKGQSTLSTDPALAAQEDLNVTGTYSGPTEICTGGTTTDSEALRVVPAQLIALCLEPADTNGAFDTCRNDTGACVTADVPLTIDSKRQLRLRARYEAGAVDRECNVTNAATSSFSSDTPAVVSVSNDATTGRGELTANGEGSAVISASSTIAGVVVNSNNLTANVRLNEVLGSNSVTVSAKSLSIPGEPSKFACVGATDLVGGLADSSRIQGVQRLYAGARFCTPEQRVDGVCQTFVDGDTYRDVTNDDGFIAPNEPGNRINWEQSPGYWNGEACVTTLPASLPIGGGAPATVGDNLTPPADYAAGNRLVNQNGVVVGTGNLRLGFTCVTAEYTNPRSTTNKDLDGMTVLVLPVTNDVILGQSNDEDATQLCAALESVFMLGGSANGGSGVVTQVLSAVTEIVNPILQALASGDEPGNTGPIPVDDIVDELLGALSDPLTRTLFATPLGDLVALLDNTVYAPVLCGVDTLLTAILTADPEAFEDIGDCVPAAPTFPFPVPAPAPAP